MTKANKKTVSKRVCYKGFRNILFEDRKKEGRKDHYILQMWLKEPKKSKKSCYIIMKKTKIFVKDDEFNSLFYNRTWKVWKNNKFFGRKIAICW